MALTSWNVIRCKFRAGECFRGAGCAFGKHLRLLVGFEACLLLSGCLDTSVNFATNTVVAKDGTVVRTTKYLVDSRGSYEEVKARYTLPDGGSWSDVKKPNTLGNATGKPSPYQRVYTAVRRFDAGQPISSDFIRRAKASTQTARNEVTTRVHHFWFVDIYDYKETFADIVTEPGFSAAVHEFYLRNIRALAAEIARRPELNLSSQEAMRRLRAAWDPLVERFVARFRAECFDPPKTPQKCFDDLESQPSEDDISSALAAVFPIDAKEWGRTLDTLVSQEDTDPLEDQLFGVHGFPIFTTYGFRLALSLPGRYTANNANVSSGDRLTWSFDHSAFLFHPYTLFARSRVIHWGRIVTLGVLLITLSAFFVLLRMRSKRHL